MEKKELAINGGPKAIQGYERKSEPKIGNEEFLEMAKRWGYPQGVVDEISKVIGSAELGEGPHLAGYNDGSKMREMGEYATKLFGAKYALPITSGTAALHSAYVAVDICCGDEVIVPGYMFAATAMAVVVARGIPVWCDIDESMTIDPADIEKRITPRTKAIAAVHMSGYVCDMDAIMDIAKRHDLMVIEDCAQACGDSFHGKRVGTIGDIGCFSISSYKTTGGGEGGLILTNNEKLFRRVQQWSEGGGLWRPDRFGLSRWPGELFCGLNYRMSDMAATVNLVQLTKMDAQLNRRRTNKRRIISAVPAYRELKPQVIHDLDGEHGNNVGLFAGTAEEAERLAAALRAEGVGSGTRGRSDSRNWHIYKYVQHVMEKMPATSDGCPWKCPKTGEEAPVQYSPDMCPQTLDLLSRHVTVPVDQWWTERDCRNVAAAMTKVFDAFYTRDNRYENLLAAITK